MHEYPEVLFIFLLKYRKEKKKQNKYAKLYYFCITNGRPTSNILNIFNASSRLKLKVGNLPIYWIVSLISIILQAGDPLLILKENKMKLHKYKEKSINF